MRKAHLIPVPEELLDDEPDADENGGEEEMGLQVMPSVLYKQSQVAIKYLRKLLDGKIFDNPKDHEILARLIEYVTTSGDLVLDFFAGSGPTGQAVMEINAKSGEGAHLHSRADSRDHRRGYSRIQKGLSPNIGHYH